MLPSRSGILVEAINAMHLISIVQLNRMEQEMHYVLARPIS